MGIFSRLFRKKDDFGLKDELGLDGPSYKPVSGDELGLPELEKRSSLPELPEDDFPEPEVSPLHGYRPQTRLQPVQPGAMQPQPGTFQARDIELILSKLDTIRSILTNLDIRISNLETVAGINDKKRNQW
ncbi:hypothetical protein HY497_02395 [Candidatus Woesearchaeota archaeon]|nr:hypothetical protein [Candidatus Woesearchaeota archaeon]